MYKTHHPLYTRWRAMKGRCYDTTHKAYPRYGGVGITMSDEWMDFWTFANDIGDPPSPIHTVDRKDSKLGYSAENCKWSTPVEQSNNMKTNIRVEIGGINLTVKEWADRNGLNCRTCYGRINDGWDLVDAVTFPADRRRQKYRTLKGRMAQ